MQMFNDTLVCHIETREIGRRQAIFPAFIRFKKNIMSGTHVEKTRASSAYPLNPKVNKPRG